MGLFRYAPATASEAAAANSKRAISEHKVQYSYLNNQLIAGPIVSAQISNSANARIRWAAPERQATWQQTRLTLHRYRYRAMNWSVCAALVALVAASYSFSASEAKCVRVQYCVLLCSEKTGENRRETCAQAMGLPRTREPLGGEHADVCVGGEVRQRRYQGITAMVPKFAFGALVAAADLVLLPGRGHRRDQREGLFHP